MSLTRRGFGWFLVSAVAAATRSARAQAGAATTTIKVSDMHCANCARKIARKLYAVPGVVKVGTNVSANIAVVTPQADRAPSPKGMWEAVEQAGFKPVSLAGPAGTFTAKPQQ